MRVAVPLGSPVRGFVTEWVTAARSMAPHRHEERRGTLVDATSREPRSRRAFSLQYSDVRDMVEPEEEGDLG